MNQIILLSKEVDQYMKRLRISIDVNISKFSEMELPFVIESIVDDITDRFEEVGAGRLDYEVVDDMKESDSNK